ncbi:RARR2 protein, partial [Alcedo cyanopectus]|nr:RARR2 protein [Ceyx cyanopectus]
RPGMRVPLGPCLALLAAVVVAGQPPGQPPPRSPLQRRVLRDLLEYFHGRPNVHFFFREQALEGVVERVRGAGRPRREPPTSPPRVGEERWRPSPRGGGRKPTCLACYKFDTGDVPKVLDKYHNCGPSHHLAAKEIKHRDEAECRAVEEAGKAPSDGLYLPGMFAFSKGLPA